LLNIHNYTEYRNLLENAVNIAVVGLSPKVFRPSNMVARYLMAAGYSIIPVNPGQESILNQPCFAKLTEIDQPVDIVNIFRRSEGVFPIVEDAVRIGAKAVWMQEGIINHEAAEFARQNGLAVVMDRCIKIEHMAIFPISR